MMLGFRGGYEDIGEGSGAYLSILDNIANATAGKSPDLRRAPLSDCGAARPYQVYANIRTEIQIGIMYYAT